ncbi:TIGR03943 family protein [Paenibacillus sp. sptzw28]|uniref:TIGR03943 family putative permease subunit n=1 Tax=Paenibacillus sp. sptzw28 TaxID=715179 RepID=UPI001C6ED1FD|nr:TIGR03943 family protein [Paenibacillus sp. sptzw28]QYR20542.1 TIGR03943 family protein [Paenibacillus sp. sptzw28]
MKGIVLMSTDDRRRLIHHLLRAAVMSGFAVYIVYLVRTDSLSLYIAPRMELYVKLSAIGLYATAIYQVYAAFRVWMGYEAAECDCNHEPSPSLAKNTLIYGLFVLPLALGFLLPESTLGSSLAAKKGVSFSGSGKTVPAAAAGTGISGQSEPAADSRKNLDELFPADEYTAAHAKLGKQLYKQDTIEVPDERYIETLTTLDLYRRNFVGKTVEISGFVYRQNGMKKSEFAVSRFAMNCCSADSVPYGLMVDYPRAPLYKNDVWLKVRGTVTESTFDGNPIILLKARQIQVIEMPDTPYVYPDYNFGS